MKGRRVVPHRRNTTEQLSGEDDLEGTLILVEALGTH